MLDGSQFGFDMKSKSTLTFGRFLAINCQLIKISDTWSDLWVLIFYTGLSVGRLIALQYKDIDGDSMWIRKQGRLKELCIELCPPAMTVLSDRRKRYPDDVFVFQSHSNRMKNECRPVTVIAFNAALRRAGETLPNITVSSCSARNLTK